MQAGKDLYETMMGSITSDDAGMGVATFLCVAPILAPFANSVNTPAGDLTLDTDSLAPLAATAEPSNSLNPVTNEPIAYLPPPAGGWEWDYDGATPPLNTQIFGWAVLDKLTKTKVYGLYSQNPPMTLVQAGRVVLPVDVVWTPVFPPMQ